MSVIHNHKDLIVWQKAMQVVVEVYTITKQLPPSELYGLISQMRRSAVSIPSNIAEDRRRETRGDYLYFLRVAYSSGAELETQIEICKRLSFVSDSECKRLNGVLLEVIKLLNRIIFLLRTKTK